MKKLILSCLATAGILSFSSCETIDDDDDHDHRNHNHGTTTTTTEETTLRSRPLSTTVETETVRSYSR